MASSLFSKLTFSQSHTSVIDDVENLSCPICLEIYNKPMRVSPCGHVFCKECLHNYNDVLEPACPVCRRLFTVSSSRKATDIEKCIGLSSTLCRGCSNKVPLSKLRHHNSSCAGLDAITKETVRQIGTVNEAEASKIVNRQTFRCPYCGLQNLDTHGLLKHCNDEHAQHPGRVVCPICAVMPWGNKHQKSSDFLRHLNLRHQFEYDFVVDFSLDDQSMLDKAIKASLEEQ